MTENHKITAQPGPTTESRRFRGKIDIVRIDNKHIALPTNQYSFDPNAQTNPKKCKPTMIEIMGRRNRLRSPLLNKRTARKIKMASKATERPEAFSVKRRWMRGRNLSCSDNDTQRNRYRNREKPGKPASTEIACAGSDPN